MWARRVEHVREGGDCQYVVMRSVGHAVGCIRTEKYAALVDPRFLRLHWSLDSGERP